MLQTLLFNPVQSALPFFFLQVENAILLSLFLRQTIATKLLLNKQLNIYLHQIREKIWASFTVSHYKTSPTLGTFQNLTGNQLKLAKIKREPKFFFKILIQRKMGSFLYHFSIDAGSEREVIIIVYFLKESKI